MKYFDKLTRMAVKTVNRIYGETAEAVWVPSDGSLSFTGIVLFNNPTAKETLDKTEFVTTDAWMEYFLPAFADLKRLVDKGLNNEVIEISGFSYFVTHVDRLSDGLNCKAYLQPVDNDYGPQNQED